MSKSTRQWIERSWAETSDVLRAQDIQYDVTYTIEEEVDRKPYSLLVLLMLVVLHFY